MLSEAGLSEGKEKMIALIIASAAFGSAVYTAWTVRKNNELIRRCMLINTKVIEKCERIDKRYMDLLGRMDGVEKRRDLFETTVRCALNHYEEEIHSLLDRRRKND